MTHALAWVKQSKIKATIPLSISFPWAREGKPQTPSLNTLNTQKYIPLSSLSISPMMHLFWHTQNTCGTLQNCPIVCIKCMYFSIFPWILSFYSNKKAWNAAPSFQFMTPGRELTQKSMKSIKFQHFQLLKEMKFGPHQNYSWPRTSDLAKSEQNDTKFQSFQYLHSKTPIRKAWIS